MSDRHIYKDIPGVICPNCGRGNIDVTAGILSISPTVCLDCGYTGMLRTFWNEAAYTKALLNE